MKPLDDTNSLVAIDDFNNLACFVYDKVMDSVRVGFLNHLKLFKIVKYWLVAYDLKASNLVGFNLKNVVSCISADPFRKTNFRLQIPSESELILNEDSETGVNQKLPLTLG